MHRQLKDLIEWRKPWVENRWKAIPQAVLSLIIQTDWIIKVVYTSPGAFWSALDGAGGRRVKAVSSREGLIFSWSSFSYYSEGQHSVAFIPNSNKVRGGRHSWGHSPPSPPAIDEIFWRGKQKILNGISESCRTEDQIFWREVAKKQKFFFWHLAKFSEDFGEKRALWL